MSDWNPNMYNSPYNEDGRDSYVWNNDESGQYYSGQPTNYYNNQYVGFNEFVSQFQQSGSHSGGHEYYAENPGSYQAVPNAHITNSNINNQVAGQSSHDITNSATYAPNAYENNASSSNYPSDMRSNSYNKTKRNSASFSKAEPTIITSKVFTSNLMPTASEFVPKSVKNTVQQDYNPDGALQNSVEDIDDARSRSDVGQSSYNDDSAAGSGYVNNRNSKRKPNVKNSDYGGRETTKNSKSYSGNYSRGNGSYNSSQDVRMKQNTYEGKSRDRDIYKNKHSSGRFRSYDNRNVHPSEMAADELFAENYHTYTSDAGNPSYNDRSYVDQQSPKQYKYSKETNGPKPYIKKKDAKEEEKSNLTQRERLTDQLDRGALECLVCCERVKPIDQVWSCGNCYHVLHLKCIRKWAMSSLVDNQWRCPACQNTSSEIPSQYRCFCGRARSPEWRRGETGAHTCGDACARSRPASCPHPCTLLCHAGPCPPCEAVVQRKCGCGAETRSVRCCSTAEQVCERECKRPLNCKVHFCKVTCHMGPCEPCAEIVKQVCNCPATKAREVPCSKDTATCESWSCGGECGRVLSCGRHVCRDLCHAAPCPPCPLRPEAIVTCPCGKKVLSPAEKRKSCADPIPLCGNICAKPLTCGPLNDRHFCKLECHDGPCPPCPETTLVQCRCTHTSKEIKCPDLPEQRYNVRCQKKCNKKMSCGRHRCRELCCAANTHPCPLQCGRQLSCSLHRCENFCHTGHCPVCPRLSFEELHCRCGAAVLYPPVACGARLPPCEAPCSVVRACSHPPHHTCHAGQCPPCVVLTTKRCHGGHEERKTIPCHQEEFSCGLPCGKPLPCSRHKCIKLCHKGECATTTCTQPCQQQRPCGHPCAAPCHSGSITTTSTTAEGETTVRAECPSAGPCRASVRATCQCGRRSAERLCADNAREFSKLVSGVLASKMQDVQLGNTVDLSEVVSRPGNNLKTLECNDECRVEARNRQLAIVLQIRNPDPSAKLAPRYSDTARAWFARDPAFAAMVHDRLTDLVHLAKKSKQKTRSHSFPSMNRQKRQFIHEMCEHFGCESVAYDAEPNRNIVATADKEKSWLPAMSLMEVVGREAGKRRVPGPVLRRGTAPAPPASTTKPTAAAGASAAKSGGSGWATLTSSYGNVWASRAQQQQATAGSTVAPSTKSAQPPIDYFDNPPQN